jgi:ATP-dependent RNA helicase RhlE
VQRLGRAGKPDAVGDAFTLMSPEEQKDVETIERFLGRGIPRVLLPDFDYDMQPGELKQIVPYEEVGARTVAAMRKGPTGLQSAASRIAAAARPATNHNAPSPSRAADALPARRPAVRSAMPRPQVKTSAGNKLRKPVARSRSSRPATKSRNSRHGR